MTSPETSVSEPTANLLGRNPNFPNIEPCAHCGAMPCPPGMFMDEQWGIRCSWCNMQSRANTAEQAIASWNRRAALTAAAQVRAQAPLGNPSAQDFLAMQDRCEEFRDALEQIAEGRGITVAKIAEKAVSIARQVLMQDAPTPAPAALGIRKGE